MASRFSPEKITEREYGLKQIQLDYGAFGRRLSKATGRTITRYAWRGDVLIHQWQEDATDNTFVSDEGDLHTPVKHNFITWLYDNGSFTPCGKIANEKAYSIVSDY